MRDIEAGGTTAVGRMPAHIAEEKTWPSFGENTQEVLKYLVVGTGMQLSAGGLL
jgi:hypothetical protein